MQEFELPAAVEPLVKRLQRPQGRLKGPELEALSKPDLAMYALALLFFRGQLAEEVTTMQYVARALVHVFKASLTIDQSEYIIGQWAEQGFLIVLNDEPEKVTVRITLTNDLRKLLQAVYFSNQRRATIVYAAETVLLL